MTAHRWPDTVPTLIDPSREVVLRAHTAADLPRLIEQCTDPDFVRWTTAPHPYTAADGYEFLTQSVPARINAGETMLWAVQATLAGALRYCGTMEIRLHGSQRSEIAYALHPEARGRGLLTPAGRLAIDWAFDVAGLTVIDWQARTGNWASRHAAAALGFRFEGVRRRHLLQRGQLVDCWVGSLLADDPRVSTAAPPQPLLNGPGLRLRPVTETDVPRIVEACNDRQTRHWLPSLPDPYGPHHGNDFVSTCRENQIGGQAWTWAVTAPADDLLLGVVTLRDLQNANRQGEIGYWAHPASRGRGLIGAAVGVVADFTLKAGGPHHGILIQVAAGNQASQGVARRAGGRQVGVLPQAFRLADGSFTDLLLFARTVADR